MKRYLLLLLLVPGVSCRAEGVYKLSEALQKKLVTVSLSGAKSDTAFKGESSSHYGPCMQLEVSNASADNLTLNLEYGYKLVPDDSSLQTMIVTQTLIVKLPPRQKKNYRVYAMCSEAHDGGPTPGSNFVLRTRATGHLLGLTELLNRKKYQGNAAQNAVWCLTDNYDIQSIFSTDTTMMYELRRFVAKAKGKGAEKVYAAVTSEPYTEPEPVRTVSPTIYSGSFSYSFSRTSNITIALYDEDNKLKKTYLSNQTQGSGEHTYNYKVSSEEMDNKRHYVRLYRDGRLYDEVSIIPHD